CVRLCCRRWRGWTCQFRSPGSERDDMTTLSISGLHVSVRTDEGEREILRGVDLSVSSRQAHAIMGAHGSGKSTLAYSIAGHPKYVVTAGEVLLDGEDVLA